jgi:glutamate-1-semialdehyde aminotransferase
MTDHVPDREKLATLREAEVEAFARRIPRSRALYAEARQTMPDGVPCSWMAAFYPGTEIFAARGEGAYFEDVDGNRFLDMTQCDLSMACGFGPAPVARAVAARFAAGSHFLLPTEDAIAVTKNLANRFGMPFWQFTLSASAANTEAIRISRVATGRERVLVFGGKYHGHLDETLVKSKDAGVAPENRGLPSDVVARTRVVPFNDVEALEAALADRTVACVLTEPLMTNIGVIQPDPEFHDALRRATRDTGTLLVIDETHTQVGAYGGYTRQWGLEPDILTLGKCTGGGVPLGGYGLNEPLCRLVEESRATDAAGGMAIALGGTTYGNALNMAAARAALEEVLTEEAYDRVTTLGAALADGIQSIIDRHGLPWRAVRVGNRSGICLAPDLPRNANEASAAIDQDFNLALRAYMANRGIWEPIWIHGPSVSFAHVAANVDSYLQELDGFVETVAGWM